MRRPNPFTLLYYVSFASLPLLAVVQTRLLTNYLAPSDFGTIQLVIPVLGICVVLGSLGTQNFGLRFYARDGMRVVKESLFVTVWTSVTIVVGLSLLLLTTREAFFGVPLTPRLFFSLLAAVLVKQLFAFIKVQLRSTHRHILYNVTTITERTVWVMGVVLGAVLLRDSPPANFLTGGAVLSAALLLALAPAWLQPLARVKTSLSAKRVREMLAYGAPVVAVLISSELLVTSNRYVIISAGLLAEDVARFAVGYSLATMGMQVTYEPLLTYAHPLIFSKWEAGRRAEAEAMLRRFLRRYLLSGLALGVLFWLGEALLVHLVADARYRLPSGTFAFLLAACFLTGVYRFLATKLLLETKTLQLLGCFLAALAVNVAGSILLIGPFGLRGVGAAAVAGSAVLCLLVWWRGKLLVTAKGGVLVVGE